MMAEIRGFRPRRLNRMRGIRQHLYSLRLRIWRRLFIRGRLWFMSFFWKIYESAEVEK